MRIILSFNSRDLSLAEAFRATLFVHAPDLKVFFSPAILEEHQALHLDNADAVVFFVGPHGVSESQSRDFRRAHHRAQRSTAFEIIPIVAAAGAVPEHLASALPWIFVPIVTDGNVVRQVVDLLLKRARGKTSSQQEDSATAALVRRRLG